MTKDIDLIQFLITEPTALWTLAVLGAVCVIGLADFLKNWIKRKTAIKWMVFFVSLFVSYILSPLVHPAITAVVIMWLLILAISTMARNAIVDGLPAIISKLMGKETSK